jgi:hypothetical protein
LKEGFEKGMDMAARELAQFHLMSKNMENSPGIMVLIFPANGSAGFRNVLRR